MLWVFINHHVFTSSMIVRVARYSGLHALNIFYQQCKRNRIYNSENLQCHCSGVYITCFAVCRANTTNVKNEWTLWELGHCYHIVLWELGIGGIREAVTISPKHHFPTVWSRATIRSSSAGTVNIPGIAGIWRIRARIRRSPRTGAHRCVCDVCWSCMDWWKLREVLDWNRDPNLMKWSGVVVSCKFYNLAAPS